ncbi:double-strand break repair helicase AddA [Roseixanthobacter pseudopolyaromaticivorans]|uniref:double-strand break repair helicase AddA n=1 Tax=Xanthobacteraceae TaxID=335928 RepID=UPI00372BF309
MSETAQIANAAKADATRRQGEASHPHTSAWVSANAGSGKTHVLAQRVIRLLLSGTPPGRILCLTYTKAAAANMANRVLDILGRWVGLGDRELDAELVRIDDRPPNGDLRARARRLFAAALETPGGLKIQTIHAFCGGLLHRFPFEAGVAAGFSELDDAGRLDLMARIRAALIVEATGAPAGRLGQALSALIESLSDAGVDALLEAAVDARALIEPLGGDADARRAAVARVLGVAPEQSPEEVRREMLASPHVPRSEWPSIAACLREGAKTDQALGEQLALAATAGSEAEALPAYLGVFLTDKYEPRAASRFLTKGLRTAYPALCGRLDAEKERIAGLLDRLRAVETLARTDAALTLGAEACRRYAREKAQRGLLDFDDLIGRTAELLNRVPASWVHFKLDRGIDHVLVDEAQDTSPEQWKVVEGLIADFFSGEGAREGLTRTLFVVGDEKQSIFSFQGADPRTFGDMHARFAGAAGPQDFRNVRLPHSFRSAPGVLEAVDRIFAAEAARRGLTGDNAPPVHAAIRADAPSLVEVWPTTVPAPKPKVDDWRRPLDAVPADDPVNQLAQRIAAFVRAGIEERLAIPSREGRAMQARDVLVLVRRRGRLFEAVIRALKTAGPGVDVAGADRLVIADHIAALDLMALGDALLSPDDDLALASALKSPLFGFTDDDLIILCPPRAGRLGDALAGAAGRFPHWGAAAARLETWRGEAPLLRPFDFYARVLGRDGGRRAMLARLGPEAADVLDEFMALARTYESTEPATLAGFLAFLRRGGAETKRDMESGRDEVRVMTVHGAKGLEAPIVILADTVDVPKARTAGGLLPVPDGAGGIVPILAGRKDDGPAVLGLARGAALEREREEYRRLLYVALTRAEDAVIVCGAETRLPGKDKPHARPEGCWYDLVRDALADEAVEVEAPYAQGPVLRWRKGEGFAPARAAPSSAVSSAAGEKEAGRGAGVAFLQASPLPAVPLHVAPLRPSRAAEQAPRPPRQRAAAESDGLDPILRGDLVHRLLAGLAGLEPAMRGDAGRQLLRHVASALPAEIHDALAAEAQGVLDHAELAELFGEGSVAEVPIVGRWRAQGGRLMSVSGRIDRLAVRPDRIVLADFKTDSVPPRRWEEVGGAYVSQLAIYGEVLRRAFPGKAVEAMVVYTRGPVIHSLPPEALAAALARNADL